MSRMSDLDILGQDARALAAVRTRVGVRLATLRRLLEHAREKAVPMGEQHAARVLIEELEAIAGLLGLGDA